MPDEKEYMAAAEVARRVQNLEALESKVAKILSDENGDGLFDENGDALTEEY